MARTYEETMARMAELEKAQSAQAAVPAPTTTTAVPAARAPAAPKPVVVPGMEALPKPSAAPPAPTVTRRAVSVTPKVEKVEPPKPVEIAPPPKPVALTPDMAKQIDYKKVYAAAETPFLKQTVRFAASDLGMSEDELQRLAQAQGVDLDSIVKARQKGRTYEEIAAAGRERGVIGFMPMQEREKAFNKLATDVQQAQRGDAGDTIELVRSGADKGFGPAKALAGYTFAGTQAELPEVTKPGEHGYAVAQLLVDALQKDPSAVRTYDLYGRSLATGNTQRYIDDRVDDLRKRANIKASDADAMEKMAALRKRAINEVIAYKTVGQWTPIVTLGDVEVREGRASPGVLDAMKPNIEIIGFNNKRQAIFRQESPMGVLFRVIDIPQAAVAGVLSGQTVGQGIQSGANLLEYSLDATKDSAMYVKAPVVAAGFAASILFPDALVAAGAATRATKAVTRLAKARKIAPEATALLETIVRTRKAGDYEAAAAAEKQLRSLLPDVASNLDSADAAVARFQKLAEPDSDIIDTDLAALIANAAPEQAKVIAGRPFLHPSARKFVVGPSGLEQADYAELFDTRRQLDRVQRAKAEYVKTRTTGRSVTDYTRDYVRGRVHDVFENLPAERQLSLDQVKRMANIISAQAPAALLDQKQFKKAVEDALKADAEFGTDTYKMARQDAYKAIGGRTETKLDEIRGKTIEELEAADMGLFDRAIKAIEQNNTARGVAAQLLRDEIAKTARLRVEPLELFDEVAPKLQSGEPIRLTPGGLLLLHHLRKAFPKQDFKEAYATITIIDKMIEGAAQAREVSPMALYQEIFPLIKQGTPEDLKRLAGDLKAGKVPTSGAPTGGAPAAPAAPTKAARARAEAKLREMMRRMGDEELDEIEGLLRADGVQEGEAYALDAIKREKARRAREAKKAAAAAPAAAPVADAERIAQLQDELEQAVESGDEFRQGELEMEIENLRRTAEPEAAPTPVVAEEVVEAPAAAPVTEAPPVAAPAAPTAGLVSAQRTDFKSVDEFKQAVIDAGGVGFVTKQGSVYQQTGPVTQRFKTLHIEHDPKDIGLKKPSKRTIYLRAKLEGGGPDRLRETGVGLSNASTRWLIDDTTNRAYLVSRVKDGPIKEYRFDVLRKDADGKTIPFVEFDTQPFMGAVVLELFDDAAPVPTMVGKDKVADLPGHKSFHPGNQITEMFGPVAAEPPTPAPIAAAAEAQPEAAKIVEAPAKRPRATRVKAEAPVEASVPPRVFPSVEPQASSAARVVRPEPSAAAAVEMVAPGITDLRRAMLEAAGDETAFDPKVYTERKEVCKLTGHCNAAAYIVQKKYGGELLSTKVQGETHVWNRLPDGTQVDLTGSQYGGDGFTPVVSGGKVVPPRATVNPRFKKFEAKVAEAAQAGPAAPKPPDVLSSIEPLARTAPSPWAEVPQRFIVAAETRLRKAADALDAGRINVVDYDVLVGDVRKDLTTQKAERAARKAAAPLERGASEVRSRLLKAQAAGVIDEAGVDLADWLIRQNPRIADDLNVSILTAESAKKRFGVDVGESVAGFYEPLERVVALIKERGSEQTAVHEILHHTEQMLPEALQTAVRDEWAKQLAKALRDATPEQRPALEKALTGQSSALLQGVGDGTLPRSFYQFVNTSEFWAVNASRIVSGRYAAFNKGLVARAKQWLTEFVQKVKSIFRLPSDAPLIRGLDAVLKGDGTFVSEEMLSQGDIYRSIEARAGALRGYIEPEQRPVAATLFSGGGLVEAGLQNVVRPGYAVEARGDIAAHYGKVFGEHVENVDVRSVDFNRLKDKDIGFLHASPVCKNFSAAKAVNAAGEQALDIETATATARAIDELKPPVFTLENVADYLDSDALRRIEDALARNGYTFDKNVYNAADYGGATTRKRLIIRAVREGELPPLPTKTGSADWYERVSDLVDDLPPSDMPPFMQRRLEAAGIDWKNVDRPLMVAGGSAWADELPYAFAGGPTFTIKATPKELHRIILPGGDVREATPRVLARITGLSDDYPLPKTKDAAVTIIGNGIPLEMTDAVIAPVIESRAAQASRVFPSIEAEAPMPSGIPSDALRQVSPTGEVKGAVEWLEDGSSVIYLFEGADASTVLHEVAHVVRRNILSNEDMGFIASWVQGLGVNVGHQYGEFTGDAAEIEKAEELFAKAFEQYVAEGKAPAGLEGAFAQLKDAVANVYKAVKDPVIGVELQPEVRRVFDGLFATEPKQADLPLKEAIRRGILGGPEAEVDILTVLSREAKRKGLDQFSPDELVTRINEAKANIKQIAKRDPVGTDVVLKFDTKVMGKDKWTLDDLAAAQAARDARLAPQAEARMALQRDLTGKGRGKAALYKQDTAVESLWTALSDKETDAPMTKQAKKALRGVTSMYFGGNVLEETKTAGQPPAFRRALDTSARIVEQSLADTVALVNDAVETKDDTQLLRYLTGDFNVAKVSGRPILSSGHDKMGAVNRMIQRAIAAFKDDEKAALIELADAINTKDPVERGQKLTTLGFTADGGEVSFKEADEARKAMSDALRRAVGKLLYPEKQDADIGTALAAAIRDSVNAPEKARPSHELRLVETLTYLGGVTARDGDLFKGDSKDVVRTLLGDIRKIYGENGEESARRVAVQIGAFGGADQAKQFLARMGLGVDENTQAAFARFLNGEQVGAENIEGVRRMLNTFGRDVNFVADAALDVDFYIPRAARERMAQVLSRAQFRTGDSVGAADALATSYRYMKTRMTRGNFFIRQRYFMMNTVDHFNAMAYTAGFGIAAASTARVVAQDLLVVPAMRELLEVGKATGVLSPVATERLRSSLQKLGDRAAGRIGEMMSVGKYRIEVNPILEGVDGGFTVGGKVYRYRDIRDIAVEEGVFSSFDTRELQRAILREGQLVLGDAAAEKAVVRSPTRLAWMRNGLASLEESVADIAEAWGERERLGAMVTLMEAGYDPRTAAQITIKALFDYSQSLTKADRYWLVGMLLPFWAFQKNANQQVFNMLFSPWGGYRMMVVKRARERTSDLLGNIMYNTLVDDYGVDVESMPPELQDSYYSTIKAFEEAFGPDGPTPEGKRAMRLLLSGRAIDVEGGVLVEASAEIQRLRSAGAFADLARFIPFTVAEPSKASRSSIMRDRAGFPVPFPRSEGVRVYNALLGDNHSYMELYWPDSTIEAGMKWHTQVAATMFLLTAEGAAQTGLTGLREGGIEEVTVQRVLQPIIDVERSPLIAPFLEQPPPKRIAEIATPEAWVNVHPMLGKTMDDLYGTTFLRVPATEDPLLVDEDGNLPQLTPEKIAEIQRLQEQYPDIGVLKKQRYYLPGGVWATAFENSPLGELNSLLLRWEEEPLESQGRKTIQGQILIWARKYAGVDVTLTAPSQAAKREEPRKKTETAGTKTF